MAFFKSVSCPFNLGTVTLDPLVLVGAGVELVPQPGQHIGQARRLPVQIEPGPSAAAASALPPTKDLLLLGLDGRRHAGRAVLATDAGGRGVLLQQTTASWRGYSGRRGPRGDYGR